MAALVHAIAEQEDAHLQGSRRAAKRADARKNGVAVDVETLAKISAILEPLP